MVVRFIEGGLDLLVRDAAPTGSPQYALVEILHPLECAPESFRFIVAEWTCEVRAVGGILLRSGAGHVSEV